MISDYVKTASESRANELEAAIERFRDCGVELARFSVQEHEVDIEGRVGMKTILCIDGTLDIPSQITPDPVSS